MKRLKNKIIEIFYILMIKSKMAGLDMVPENLKSTRLCLTAYKTDPYCIIDFPKDRPELFKEEIILDAIDALVKKESEFYINDVIKSIPKEYITNKIYLTAFDKEPDCIKYFPKDRPELFKEEMILEGLNKSTYIVNLIPEEYMTNKIYLTAFYMDRYVIEYFPKDRPELFNEDVLLKVIKFFNGIPIKYNIPEKYITNKLYLLAFDKDPQIIKYFPEDREELFKEEMIFKAVLEDDTVLSSIPEKYIPDKIYLSAFVKNPRCIEYFPKDRAELFTEEIILKAIEYDPNNIKYIPYKYIDNEKLEKFIGDII